MSETIEEQIRRAYEVRRKMMEQNNGNRRQDSNKGRDSKH